MIFQEYVVAVGVVVVGIEIVVAVVDDEYVRLLVSP